MVVEVPNFGRRFHEESSSDDQGLGKSHLIKPLSYFQITELNHATPLFKILNNYTRPVRQPSDRPKGADVALKILDGRIFSTEWTELVGTDMIFDDEGELLAISRDHLQVDEQISLEVAKERPETENDERPTRGVLEEQPRSLFLRKAIRHLKMPRHRISSARATMSPATRSGRATASPAPETGDPARRSGSEVTEENGGNAAADDTAATANDDNVDAMEVDE